jgi:uncharacterized repeat protein (TIGR03803 family)
MLGKMLTSLTLPLLVAVAPVAAPAQTFTSLFSFNGTNGQTPDYGYLTQGIDGKFYGTTAAGGSNAGGTVFKITPQGALTTIYNFCSQPNCADGKEPLSGVVLGTDGYFYGTTSAGGASGDGTVFQITSGGVLTTLHSFSGTDGETPAAQLVQGTDGEFYGSTQFGGVDLGDGTIFKITSGGSLLTITTFYDNKKEGSNPFSALVQGKRREFLRPHSEKSGALLRSVLQGHFRGNNDHTGIDGNGWQISV